MLFSLELIVQHVQHFLYYWLMTSTIYSYEFSMLNSLSDFWNDSFVVTVLHTDRFLIHFADPKCWKCPFPAIDAHSVWRPINMVNINITGIAGFYPCVYWYVKVNFYRNVALHQYLYLYWYTVVLIRQTLQIKKQESAMNNRRTWRAHTSR